MLTLSQKEIVETLKATPAEYMAKSLEQRNPGPLSAGSTFHSPQTLNSLCQIQWERYEDPDCEETAISFRGSLPGKLGIAQLSNIDPETTVYLRPAHKGQHIIEEEDSPYWGEPATELVGDLSQVNLDVDYTTLILGRDENSSTGYVFWTLFPGPCSFAWPAVGFDTLTRQYEVNNDGVIPVAASHALKMGFNFVKHVTEYNK